MASFFTLPIECIVKIFELSDCLDDAPRLAQTCKTLHTVYEGLRVQICRHIIVWLADSVIWTVLTGTPGELESSQI